MRHRCVSVATGTFFLVEDSSFELSLSFGDAPTFLFGFQNLKVLYNFTVVLI